ncbi:MAG: hypothetical protein U0L09_09265, partial [Christensenellales bacterium]|nr:hypothetical protein [Christensenellales bacterium]
MMGAVSKRQHTAEGDSAFLRSFFRRNESNTVKGAAGMLKSKACRSQAKEISARKAFLYSEGAVSKWLYTAMRGSALLNAVFGSTKTTQRKA